MNADGKIIISTNNQWYAGVKGFFDGGSFSYSEKSTDNTQCPPTEDKWSGGGSVLCKVFFKFLHISSNFFFQILREFQVSGPIFEDFCAAANCDDNAECKNHTDGFECTCNEGYTGDGETCTAIPIVNECETGNFCKYFVQFLFMQFI